MEEAIGDCTNLHISYPNLVYGFLHIMKANLAGPAVASNDVAITAEGKVSASIRRYHDAMAELTGVEASATITHVTSSRAALVRPNGDAIGELLPSFPAEDNPPLFALIFESLYRIYDHRFVYAGRT